MIVVVGDCLGKFDDGGYAKIYKMEEKLSKIDEAAWLRYQDFDLCV